MKKEKWFLSNKKADFLQIAADFDITPVTARILRNREICSREEISLFLSGTLQDLGEPLQMFGIKEAVSLLSGAIEKKQKIRVILDYDVDGCMSGCILVEAVSACGGIVDYDIPNRILDGYGMNERMAEAASQDGIEVVLTCDNGIAAFDAVKRAKELGMAVIVTDHHEVPFVEREGKRKYILPPADVVVDPKQEQETYPFREFCGAGVAYKLAEALFIRWGIDTKRLLPFLEYAALATVCDIVDLKGENRILVKEGLKQIRSTENIGLSALIEASGITKEQISYYHIGFILGPAINAGGRLETAKMAVELFLSGDEGYAKELAEQLKRLNDSRKEMTKNGYLKAVEKAERLENLPKVLVLYLENCHESVAGIIAGRVKEKFHRPVFIFTDTAEEELLKGSGRSIEGYHMFEALLAEKELLDRFGGHPMAAGVTVRRDRLSELSVCLNENCLLTEQDMLPKITIDVPLRLIHITDKLMSELVLLEPFGKGNHQPVFAAKGLRVENASVLGKQKNVLKLRVTDEEGQTADAVYFGDIPSFLQYVSEKFGEEAQEALFQHRGSIKMDFIYYPKYNIYRGRQYLQLQIQSFR